MGCCKYNKPHIMYPSADHIIYHTGFYSQVACDILTAMNYPNVEYEIWHKKGPADLLRWRIKRDYETNEVIAVTTHKSYSPYFEDHFSDFVEFYIEKLKKRIVRNLTMMLIAHPIEFAKYKFFKSPNAEAVCETYIKHDWTFSLGIDNTKNDDSQNSINAKANAISSSWELYYVWEPRLCGASVKDLINIIKYFKGDESVKDKISQYIVKNPLNPLELQAKIAFRKDLEKIYQFAPTNETCCINLEQQLKIFIEKYFEVANNWWGISSIIDEQIEETINAFHCLMKERFANNGVAAALFSSLAKEYSSITKRMFG